MKASLPIKNITYLTYKKCDITSKTELLVYLLKE